MKRVILFLVMLSIGVPAIGVPGVDACVGKTLFIGAVDSTEGQVLSAILATIINERTGTTVNTKYYRNTQELYDAVSAKKVDMLIENTSRAMRIINKSPEGSLQRTYEIVKSAYEKDRGLIWFKPLGFLNGDGTGQSYTAPVLKVEVLNNFPALPRVVGKLAGTIDDETYARLIKSVKSGEKAKKVARDFLKSKKLI